MSPEQTRRTGERQAQDRLPFGMFWLADSASITARQQRTTARLQTGDAAYLRVLHRNIRQLRRMDLAQPSDHRQMVHRHAYIKDQVLLDRHRHAVGGETR